MRTTLRNTNLLGTEVFDILTSSGIKNNLVLGFMDHALIYREAEVHVSGASIVLTYSALTDNYALTIIVD
jgi:hypothetical protein